MDSVYVLDSYALIAHLEDGDGAARVGGILKAANERRTKVFLSVVNFGEVYYIAYRERGWRDAEEARILIEQLPLEVVPADKETALEAAKLKAEHPIAYADCFAAALGIRKKAKVVTGDPEFKKLAESVKVEWI